MARVRMYNPALGGADYITDCLSGSALSGADQYESSKFGFSSCELMQSKSVENLLLADQRRTRNALRTASEPVLVARPLSAVVGLTANRSHCAHDGRPGACVCVDGSGHCGNK